MFIPCFLQTFQASAQVIFIIILHLIINPTSISYCRQYYHRTKIFNACHIPGTRPWSRAAGEQRIDDGLIEVVGLTTYQLPILQVNFSNRRGYFVLPDVT